MITRRKFLGAMLTTGLTGGLVPLFDGAKALEKLSSTHAEGTRFIVFGDSGSGSDAQYELAGQMVTLREHTNFEFALMLGDQIYPEGDIADVGERFVEPYFELLMARVKFYPILGNHDIQTNSGEDQLKFFGMPGRWYSFRQGDIEFFMLDSNQGELIGYSFRQVRWLAAALASSRAKWKIVAMHHPIYSSQRKPSAWRKSLVEPLFVQYGVDVVLSGHDHVYERIAPQRGVRYFVSGGGGAGVRPVKTIQFYSQQTVSTHHFILFELGPKIGRFQTIDIEGRVIDSGSFEPRALLVDTA